MGSIKIIDIANALRLSRNTVAKALGDSAAVSAQTKRKVLDKAIELGYDKLPPKIVIKHVAQKEDSLRTDTVAVLMRRDFSPFWSRVIMGVNDTLNAKGIYANFHFINEEQSGEALPASLCSNAKAVLLLSIYTEAFLQPLIDLNIPMVLFDIGLSGYEYEMQADVVLSESVHTVEHLTKLLLANGLTKIGFIGDTTYSRSIRDRFYGYSQALKAAGITPDSGIIAKGTTKSRYYTLPDVEQALAAFRYIPEAVVCANDNIALSLVQCLRARGLRVPDDVAVTGFDNQEAIIEHLTPELTTVNIDHYAMGCRLAEQLIRRMEKPPVLKEVIMVRGDIVLRESSNKKVN